MQPQGLQSRQFEVAGITLVLHQDPEASRALLPLLGDGSGEEEEEVGGQLLVPQGGEHPCHEVHAGSMAAAQPEAGPEANGPSTLFWPTFCSGPCFAPRSDSPPHPTRSCSL